MWSTLITNIKTVLDNVSELSRVYDYNISKIGGFPCAIYQPLAFENTFMTNNENFKEYNFRITIIAETKVKNKRQALIDVLAPTVDAVIAQFDQDWDGGQIDGHRIWYRISGGDWGFDEISQGEILFADINLAIKFADDN